MASLLPRTIRRRLARLRPASVALLDRALRIDTVGTAELEDLGVAGAGREGYQGSGWLDLRRMLRPGEVGPNDVFLDLGSGKGRVVLLATRYNSVRGETFDAVITSLIARVDRRPRTVRLICLNPQEHERLLATGRFRLERTVGRLRLRRDEAARAYLRR